MTHEEVSERMAKAQGRRTESDALDRGHAAGGAAARRATRQPPEPAPALPGTRHELLALHAETRRRRNAAELGSEDHRAAVVLLGRIEVEIARIERAMDPPLG